MVFEPVLPENRAGAARKRATRATWIGAVFLAPVVVGWLLLALALVGWDGLAEAAFEWSLRLWQAVMAGAPVVAALLGLGALRVDGDQPYARIVAYGGGVLFVLFVVVAAAGQM